MKTNTKTSKVKVLLTLAAISAAPMTFAQDPLLDDVESVYNSEQIDIDGEYTNKGPSAADRMVKSRRRMEKRNEQMVRKKIENIRLREEKKLARQLRGAFNGSMKNLDNMDTVRTRQSSTTKKIVVATPMPTVKKEKNIKIIPSVGLLSINSNNENIDIESGANFGLNIEGMVHSHISVGLATSYTAISMIDNTDYGRSRSNNNTINSNGFNGFNNGFSQNYNGSDADYKRLSIGVNSKFFLTTSTFRPYIGLEVSFNRVSLGYDKESINFNGFNNNNDSQDAKFTDGYAGGAIALGTEVNFNNTVGLDLELKYQRSFTGGSDENENEFNGSNGAFVQTNNDRDQDQLEKISERIQGSNFLSAKLGLIVKF